MQLRGPSLEMPRQPANKSAGCRCGSTTHSACACHSSTQLPTHWTVGEPASRVVHCTMIWLESLLRDRCPCRGSLGLASVTTGDSPARVRLLKPPRDALTFVKYLHAHVTHAGLGLLGAQGRATPKALGGYSQGWNHLQTEGGLPRLGGWAGADCHCNNTCTASVRLLKLPWEALTSVQYPQATVAGWVHAESGLPVRF